MARTGIIDIHTHIYRDETIGRQAMTSLNPNIQWNGTPAEESRCMDAFGIVRSVGLVVTPTREMCEKATAALPSDLAPAEREERVAAIERHMVERMQRNNRWGAAVGKEFPAILPFVNLDPVLMNADTLRQEVRDSVARGAKGIKLLPMQHQVHGNDRRLWPVYEMAAELGLPVLSQSGGGGATSPQSGDAWGRPMYFGEAAAAFPTVPFILAHLGRGREDDVIALARQYGNLYADTSTVPSRVLSGDMDRDTLVRLIRDIGVDHVVFGTNWPLYDPSSDIAVIESLALTEAEKQAIFTDNARSILGAAVD